MQVQTNNMNDISFGCKLSLRKKIVFNPDTINSMADILKIERRDLYKHTREMNLNQFDFFRTMTNKYNGMYYGSESKEAPETLFKIMDYVGEPTKIHHKILESVTAPFEDILTILKSVKDKKEADFAARFKKDVIKTNEYAQCILTDIFTSPYKDEYIKNIGKYKSYLRLNKDKVDAVKELDKMIAENTFNPAQYDKEFVLSGVDKQPYVNLIISNENLDTYYSKEGVNFVRQLGSLYHATADFSEKDAANILEMYKTCNSNNIETRTYILDKFKHSAFNSGKYSDEIKAMKSIFEKIDSNEYTQRFIDEYLKEAKDIKSLRELNEILENVPPQKGYIFHKNLVRIINITKPGEERNRALKEELDNLSFETEISRYQERRKKDAIKYGFAEKESFFSKLYTRLENTVNKIRYSLSSKKEDAKEAVQDTIPQVNSEKAETVISTKAAEIVKPVENVVIETNPKESEFIQVPKFEHELAKPTEEESGIKLVNTIMTKAQKKKIEVQNSVKEYIHKTLHPNIVAEQERIYANKATKMRLDMLPEILSSIKDTRAADKAVGIKKANVSNSDAVDLYTRINGYNRKLVNYMLKQRNTDGTRMFTVPDIMQTLGRANRKVILGKMKQKEEKAYYEHLYQAKLEQYGKLRTPKKQSSKKITK